MTNLQTRIIVLPALSDLIDEFSAVLADPSGRHGGPSVAHTDAQISVLGHVRAAYVNQKQIPIPTETSAARGAYVALRHAADRIALLRISLEGDLQPLNSDRLSEVQDEHGRLNPMRLFEQESLLFGLYPFTAIGPELRGELGDGQLQQVSHKDTMAFVTVEDALD